MNYAISYLQGVTNKARTDIEESLQKEQSEVLMKEANKVSSVIDIMGFWANECHLDFRKLHKHLNVPEADQRQEAICFNSCTAKSFEMKQIESLYSDLY